tara:strand:+ start:1701 stop:1928 length:228 start_codon:yes stop_codon:yes gene_type:complete
MVNILRKLFGESQNFKDETHALKKQSKETESLKEMGVLKFNPKKRIDAEKDSEKEKMDKGFNGKTYTINGIEYDF